MQNTVQANVRDLTRVGKVIDAATAAGAGSVGGVAFDLSDRGKAEAEALDAGGRDREARKPP